MHAHNVNQAMKSGKIRVGTIVQVKEGDMKRGTILIGEGINEVKRYTDRLLADTTVGEKKLYEEPFSPEEKSNIQTLLAAHVIPLARSSPGVLEFSRGEKKHKRELHLEIADSPNPYELFDVSQAVNVLIQKYKEAGRSTSKLTTLNTEILRVLLVTMVQRDLMAFRWKDSPKEMYDAVVEVAPLPLDPDYFNDHMDEIRKRVEKKLIQKHKVVRLTTEKERLRRAVALRGPLVVKDGRNHRSGGPFTRLLKILSPFEFPRAKRREAYQEFSKTILERKAEKKKGNKYKGIVRYHAFKAFKASRMAIREKLRNMGFNSDKVMADLDLMSASTSSTVNVDIMRRLNTLSGITRNKVPIEQIREAIADMTMRYRAKKYGAIIPASAPNTASVPTQNPVNLNKLRKREERKRRRREEGHVKTAGPPAPKVELPTTLPELLHFASQAPRIDGRIYSRLRDVLHSVKPTTENGRFIIEGLKIIILCVRVSNYGIKGRVEPDVLRKKSSPQHLHMEFDQAVRELIRDGKLKYELHGHKNDYVTLTDSYRALALGRYDFRRADDQQH